MVSYRDLGLLSPSIDDDMTYMAYRQQQRNDH